MYITKEEKEELVESMIHLHNFEGMSIRDSMMMLFDAFNLARIAQDEDTLYNGKELLLEVYLVLWDEFSIQAVFRNELEAEEFISNHMYPSMYSIKELDVR